MCFDEFEAEQRLARLSCYCLYHEECIVSYWENPSSASRRVSSPWSFGDVLQKVADYLAESTSEFCPTHRELDTTSEMQMRAI